MAQRMRLIDHGWNVELEYHDRFSGEDVSRVFWVPTGGGHVRQTTWKRPGVLGDQVCERLSSRGHTLWATPDTLSAVIRREYRRMRRAYREE